MEKILHIDTETDAPPEFVVAAAKQTQQAEPYWPGKDYPDRDVWLAKRKAQREKAPERRIYTGRQPLALGINNAKRMVDGDGNPKHTRGKRIVKHRHGYYRDRYEGKRSTQS